MSINTSEHHIDIEKELRRSYLEYSLSVIIGRAIPDARDGLKPVHRRILYAMSELGNTYNRAHKKSARVVGDVIGKYHPHGDTAVYDALVRLAQDFNMREPLVDGQGNFGSIDGDSAAAMRYTEVRMARITGEFLGDLEKNTVNFRPNYDGSLDEPAILPTKVPNLLLNGSSGIAVGMATNIPTHNLGELCDAVTMLIDNPDADVDALMNVVKGPDFPTRGLVYAGKGLSDAYRTGRGTVKIRGRVEVEDRAKNSKSLVIREIPYGVNKSLLVKKISQLINERKIDGVVDLRDESDRRGIRIVVDLRRGVIPDIVTKYLYKYTQLETSFGINMLAVVDNRPILLNLKTALTTFLDFRREVVIRRTRFDLEKSEARAHILEGLRIAIDNIDEVVALIRASSSPDMARQGLMVRFDLDEVQAKAILDMRLQRLTGLQREEIENEYKELLHNIVYFKSILAEPQILRSVIRDEIQAVRAAYATPRMSEIILDEATGIEVEDLISDDEMVITLSRRGYIKRTSLENYHQQHRGGKGIAGMYTSEDDYVQEFLTTTNHQHLCLFTNKGRMYPLKVYQVPEGNRTAKGVHLNNLIPLGDGEWVTNALALRSFAEDKYFFFVTSSGMVKRSQASLYSHGTRKGIIAVDLKEDDSLVLVRDLRENDHAVLITKRGYAIRFACSEARPTGRSARGVKGMSLKEQDQVVAAVILKGSDMTTTIMSVSEKGYGKRSSADLYRLQSRGGSGIINFKVTNKTGNVVAAMPVKDVDGLVVLTSTNKIIRISAGDILTKGRATMGVKIVNLDAGACVVACDRIDDGAISRNMEED